MKFVDYKCNDCGEINEYYIDNEDVGSLKCPNCGGSNLSRVFTSVSCRSSSGDSSYSDNYSSGKSCSGSCSGCSGCS